MQTRRRMSWALLPYINWLPRAYMHGIPMVGSWRAGWLLYEVEHEY